MLLLILLLTIRFSRIDTCPIFCQCYSAFDGYHITCRNARLYDIPLNLTNFLQTTEHQNLIIDLSSNFLTILPCNFIQISTIITLILTNNQIKSIPLCFSQSSIQKLLLNENHVEFNQTNILSSSKLLHLDLSFNQFSSLPRTFFFHLRRLRTLILNGEKNLFEENNQQWMQSLTTRNQLTMIICDENFHLSLCLFDNLFQSKKLLAIELNTNIHCDCSLVYLPLEKIHFHYCQFPQQQQQQGICNIQSSRFEQGHSLIDLQNKHYRQICVKEYQTCQNIQMNKTSSLTTNYFSLPFSTDSIELVTLIKSSTINQSISTTSLTTTTTLLKKENMTAGAIIPLVLLLFIVTMVCLYVILSGHFFKMKNREKITDLIIRRKKQQDRTNNSDEKSTRLDECIHTENVNMNSNLQNNSFSSYHQRRHSSSDEESQLTFYSINNNNNRNSSTSFIQSSMTEIDIASLSSTINSSLSTETVIICNRNQQRIYS